MWTTCANVPRKNDSRAGRVISVLENVNKEGCCPQDIPTRKEICFEGDVAGRPGPVVYWAA